MSLDFQPQVLTTPKGADNHPSLEGMHGTVKVPQNSAGFWPKVSAYFGPAVLISVGYMDPGNWGTDLAAGAHYKYGLLWVVGLASMMAIIMQVLAARLGVVTGKDLAQCCRDFYPRWTRWPNWMLCELAIGACDLAEVLGSAVALNLLFHIKVFYAVMITGCDVLLLLGLQKAGMRRIEAIVLLLVGTIAGCYFLELFVLPSTHPSFFEMGRAISHPTLARGAMMLLAIEIVGATVMPHNLYLHSALVQSRQIRRDDVSIRSALRFNAMDSTVALGIAFLVNAAILVLAGMVFFGHSGTTVPGQGFVAFNDNTDWIRIAHMTLTPLLGAAAASTLFAIALLASGQSSTITGTLAGQVVMEGFMHWRISPAARRMLTRLLAIIPAVVILGLRGDQSTTDLINLSQAILAIQLPLAMLPLLHFTSSKKRMGKWKNGLFLLITGWASAILIIVMDIQGIPECLRQAWHLIRG